MQAQASGDDLAARVAALQLLVGLADGPLAAATVQCAGESLGAEQVFALLCSSC